MKIKKLKKYLWPRGYLRSEYCIGEKPVAEKMTTNLKTSNFKMTLKRMFG